MKQTSWPACLASLAPLQTHVETFARKSGIDSKRLGQLSIALEEVVINIISHAYANPEDGDISIVFKDHSDRIIISVIDSGIPFDPFGADEPDLDLDLMERPIGGLGILMVRKFMDGVTYERRNNENILSLILNKKPMGK